MDCFHLADHRDLVELNLEGRLMGALHMDLAEDRQSLGTEDLEGRLMGAVHKD
jgi:hypothetical protein